MKHLTKKATGVLLAAAALLAIGSATAVAGVIVTEHDGAGTFAATMEARALAAPTAKDCKALPAVQKLEARYVGTFTLADPPGEHGTRAEVDSPIASDPPSETEPPDPERFLLNFSLEALYDRAAGAGHAQGKWTLADRAGNVVGRGDLRAVVTAKATEPPEPDAPGDAQPPEPDLQLHGLLIGAAEPPDPDRPALSLLAGFSASLADGALNFTGSVGDPTAVGDAAALLPAVKC
jgi:hypothetical protein